MFNFHYLLLPLLEEIGMNFLNNIDKCLINTNIYIYYFIKLYINCQHLIIKFKIYTLLKLSV